MPACLPGLPLWQRTGEKVPQAACFPGPCWTHSWLFSGSGQACVTWVTGSGHPVRGGKMENSAAGGRRQTCLQTWALSSHVTLGKLHKLSNIHFPHLQNGANNSACFVRMLWESPVVDIQVSAQGLPKNYKYPLERNVIIEYHPLTLCESLDQRRSILLEFTESTSRSLGILEL